MDDTIEIFRARDFIRQKSGGGLDLEESMAAVRKLAEMAKMNADKHIMIDARDAKETVLKYSEIIEVVTEFVDCLDDPDRRIAMLPSANWVSDSTVNLTAATLSRNGHAVEVFRTFEDAIRWLSS